MKGDWCPYKECLFCQEESDCPQCDIYYRTIEEVESKGHFWMIPAWLQEFEKEAGYAGDSIEQIEQDSNRLFGAESRIMLDNGDQRVYSGLVDDTNGKFEGEI